VLHAAIALADEGGIDSLSMRKLAEELGVKAMSLYNHVANKDDVLDGIVDVAWGEIVVATGEAESGRPKSVRVAISAHETLLRHP
jgi:AcrR family transcriptional regulator